MIANGNPCLRHLGTSPAKSMVSVRSIVRRDKDINRAEKGHVHEVLMEIIWSSRFQEITSPSKCCRLMEQEPAADDHLRLLPRREKERGPS